MNLSHLNDRELHFKIKSLDAEEKRLVVEILHHLLEVERRKLFCAYGYTSLFHYTVKELGYSEDQAYRRINAMRALRALPEIEEKIESGALNMTTLSLAQNFFKGADFTKEEKLKFIETLENKSTREVDKLVLRNECSEMKLKVNDELKAKLEKLRGLKSHSAKSLEELIEMMADLALQTWNPLRQKGREQKSPASESAFAALAVPAAARKSRVVPAKLKRTIWRKHEGRCANCKSQYALEIDHIKPYGKGGLTEEGNLRLLCRACNQRHAIKSFGIEKIVNCVSK